ncbi:MAG: hypothetical protein GY765_29580 [bacterium]|nr:hypothetical protein [bacterium]
MKKTTLLVIVGCLLFVFAAAPKGKDFKKTKRDFETMAAKLTYLALESVLYDRPDHLFGVADKKEEENHFRIIGAATDREYSTKVLLKLLRHADAKVRTLAAVALFDRNDASLLPRLFPLCSDNAVTFDGHPELSKWWQRHTGIGPPEKKQRVKDFAVAMVRLYSKPAGFYFNLGALTQDRIDTYWNPRKHRSYCASWFAAQLNRTSGGVSPTQKECLPGIALLRKRIDKLPAADRAFVLLWLNGSPGSDALAPEAELVEVCKKAGREKLLLMLDNKIPCNDPDLKPRPSNNWFYKRMQIFVLAHAEQLFQPKDAKTLLDYEHRQCYLRESHVTDPTVTPWWAIAAARLDPKNGASIIKGGMKRFHGEYRAGARATLCTALWQLADRAEMDYILRWFYDNDPGSGSSPMSRSSFIEETGKEPDGKEMIAAIIRHRGLDTLDWDSLDRLVRTVNRWSKTPVMTEAELGKAWHPLGMSHFHGSQDEAKERYPKETAELLEQLERRRKCLRESMAGKTKIYQSPENMEAP